MKFQILPKPIPIKSQSQICQSLDHLQILTGGSQDNSPQSGHWDFENNNFLCLPKREEIAKRNSNPRGNCAEREGAC